MKMLFSANKRGIPKNNIQIQTQAISQNINEPKPEINIFTQLLRFGMLARIQNASGCSNCGK
jgi:hypothetical protein